MAGGGVSAIKALITRGAVVGNLKGNTLKEYRKMKKNKIIKDNADGSISWTSQKAEKSTRGKTSPTFRK